MNVPDFSMRQLLDAGIHFGHQSHRWNPKMKPYLFGVRNGIHIIDLQQTVPLLHSALVFLHEISNNSGKILFVGTKRQAQEPIKKAAIDTNQFFVTHRWPGGMLTNWKTISQSIKQMNDLEAKLEESNEYTKKLTKKETLNLQRKKDKLELSLGGIRNMNGIPDVIVIFDTNKEKNALEEAKVLNIPIINAPSAAPVILPKPPVTTTAKARTITSTPIPGTTDIIGADIAPPKHPKIQPKRKVSMKTFFTLIPIIDEISLS